MIQTTTSGWRGRALAYFAQRDLDVGRAAFLGAVAFAGLTFWFAPRPPMTDLPQHAAQMALLHDLLLGQSKWQSLLYVNSFTPYLVGTGLALPFTFVMPVSAALKLVLMLAFYGFVAACLALRRHFGGDPRLDWLFIPGFFGYSYAWGFYPFLVAAPLAVLVILLAHRYADRPTRALAAALLAANVVLFFSHGLAFLIANGIGGMFLLLKCRPWRRLVLAMPPYLVVGLLALVYGLLSRGVEDSPVPLPPGTPEIAGGWNFDRLNFLILSVGWPDGNLGADWRFAPLALLLLAAPLVLRARLNRRDTTVFAPLLITVVIWALAPSAAVLELYQRFALFLLPFYALVFRPPKALPNRPLHRIWLPLLCWLFLAWHTERLLVFTRESAAFDAVMAAAEPGERALGVIFDRAGEGVGNTTAYLHFPLWYQAEKGGFVDFNFARFMQEILRFRPERMPTSLGHHWALHPNLGFDWTRDQASIYRYFFVRSAQPLPPTYFATGRCEPVLVKSSGKWSLFENVNCR